MGTIFLLLGILAGRAGAQQPQPELPPGIPEAARAILESGDYELVARDTLLPQEFRTSGNLVVRDATVRLEGRVEGAVVVLGGELFIRPGAEISGPVIAAGGAVYESRLARTGEVIRLDAAPDGEAPRPPRLRPDGLLGLGMPTYDRVDGLTLRAGARVLLTGDESGPLARGALTFHVARTEPGGEVALELPVGGSLRLVAEAGRRTVTNETWIRGPLANTLAALTLRSDARNYHESDEVSLGLLAGPRPGLVQGESFFGPRLRLRASRDRSLPARDVWAVLGDEWRPNPAVAPGTLVSVEAGTAAAWQGALSMFEADAAVEWAPGTWGDFEFARLGLDARWTMQALWGHHLEVYGHLLHPLGGRAAPPQRWSFVGGSNTLPTFEFGEFRGDHLVFVESTYSAPVPRVRLPVLGIPALRLIHAAGTAWVTGAEMPAWEQNVGAGIAFSLGEAILYVNPADESLSPELGLGLTFPF